MYLGLLEYKRHSIWSVSQRKDQKELANVSSFCYLLFPITQSRCVLSAVRRLFCHCSGIRFPSVVEPFRDSGMMWCISHPYALLRLPYSERLMNAPQLSMRIRAEFMLGTIVALFQTACTSCSSENISKICLSSNVVNKDDQHDYTLQFLF